LGVVIISDDRARDAKQALIVSPHQNFEELGLAATNSLDERFIAAGSQRLAQYG
jgi:hypothetical protein